MTVEGFQGWPLVCVFNLIDWQVLGEALSVNFSQREIASVFIQIRPVSAVGLQKAVGPGMGRRQLGNPRDQPTPGLKQGPSRRIWWIPAA